jgi:hypothetical protein
MHPDQWVPKNPDKNFKEKQKRAIHKEHMRETAAIQAAARKVIVTEHERV